VFSGIAEREQITRLTAQLQLKLIDREEGWKKMLPVLKSWRLSELRFPREFGLDALHYSGRVPGHRKLTIQLCWRPEDRRFCGQVGADEKWHGGLRGSGGVKIDVLADLHRFEAILIE